MSVKISLPDKEDLENRYFKEGCTISSLSREYGVTNPTLRSWLMHYGIERKSHKQASTEANNRHRKRTKPSKQDLEKIYENSSIDSLEEIFKVGQQTIYEWLNEYDIPLRTLQESTKKFKSEKYLDIQFSREVLDKEYDRTKSISELAEKLGVSRSHIRQQLVKNNIKIEPIECNYRSIAEIELLEFLMGEFPDDDWEYSNRSIIAPHELDIVNNTKKIAIEYCGMYWHSEVSSGRKHNYHRDKFLGCKAKGYKLITIFDSDDMSKVKQLLLKLLGKTIKIGARKTKVKQLKPRIALDFHKNHHLHGAIGAYYHYGLYHNDMLVMVASFGKNRFSSSYEFECSRITSHSNYTVVGGVSKLINFFVKTENPKNIVTFSDLRFGEGDVYNYCGFERLQDTPPNYWYSKKYSPILFSRVKFQKHKLSSQLETYDPLKTEFENMLENNWDRIWDCGNAKYVFYNKKGAAKAAP